MSEGKTVSSEETLDSALISTQANENYTEAAMTFADNSQLHFRHTIHERWVRALAEPGDATCLARTLLPLITTFRLNAKHLDITFQDGTRWDHHIPNRR